MRYNDDMSSTRSYAVEVELPAEAFRHRPWSPSEVAADLRLLWLVDQVRERRLGHAKAAELAGMPLAAFVRILSQHHVSAIDLDDDELELEIATGAAIGKK
jgi:predicted HTH domain antitoxin